MSTTDNQEEDTPSAARNFEERDRGKAEGRSGVLYSGQEEGGAVSDQEKDEVKVQMKVLANDPAIKEQGENETEQETRTHNSKNHSQEQSLANSRVASTDAYDSGGLGGEDAGSKEVGQETQLKSQREGGGGEREETPILNGENDGVSVSNGKGVKKQGCEWGGQEKDETGEECGTTPKDETGEECGTTPKDAQGNTGHVGHSTVTAGYAEAAVERGLDRAIKTDTEPNQNNVSKTHACQIEVDQAETDSGRGMAELEISDGARGGIIQEVLRENARTHTYTQQKYVHKHINTPVHTHTHNENMYINTHTQLCTHTHRYC